MSILHMCTCVCFVYMCIYEHMYTCTQTVTLMCYPVYVLILHQMQFLSVHVSPIFLHISVTVRPKGMYVHTLPSWLPSYSAHVRMYIHFQAGCLHTCSAHVCTYTPKLVAFIQCTCTYVHTLPSWLPSYSAHVCIYCIFCTLCLIPYSWCLVCGVHYGRTAHQTGHLSWKWSYPHPVKCMSVCTYVCAYLCQVLQCILIRINMHA
jgi:hypothetical protein